MDWKMRIKRGLRVRTQRLLGLDAAEVAVDTITNAELAFVRQHFHRPKFFVLGYPRSGTTLLARLLRVHPEVHCDWQGQFVSGPDDLLSALARPGLAGWMNRPNNHWVGDRPTMALIIRASADAILERGAEQANARWVGDKTPTSRMDLAVDRLARIYPDAWTFAIVRDGRDAALSQRFQAFIDQPDTLSVSDLRLRDSVQRHPDEFGADGRSIFTEGWLRRVAADWSASVVTGHRRVEQSYGERYKALRYEDLLSDPWDAIAGLWEALGAELNGPDLTTAVQQEMGRNPAARWHAQAAPELVASLQRGAPGGWQAWFTRQDLAWFRDEALDGLRAWGYEE